jgi:outer membrane lipopolysaccharide assembly protein LptE/RlpB
MFIFFIVKEMNDFDLALHLALHLVLHLVLHLAECGFTLRYTVET